MVGRVASGGRVGIMGLLSSYNSNTKWVGIALNILLVVDVWGIPLRILKVSAKPTEQKNGRSTPNNLPPIATGGIEIDNRTGGSDCLYHSAAGLGYIRRFGRRRSSNFAIYLHCDDEILRDFPSRLTHCEGRESQLNVSTDNPKKITFGKKGKWRMAIRERSYREGAWGSLPTR